MERLWGWFDVGIHNIELSNYPIDDKNDFLGKLSRFPGELLIHHFFPAERQDLVLNLASPSPFRRHETLQYFMQSIAWSAQIGAPFFSFHAGYITDPIGRAQHGFKFSEPEPGDSKAAWRRFTEAVRILAKHAEEYGIFLLIENNVVTEGNRGKLLLSTPEEFVRFYWDNMTIDNVGILLDWGHWLVTANTYKLPIDSFRSLCDRIYGIHLHWNNGLADEHLPLRPDDPYVEMLRSYDPKFVSLEGHYQSISLLQCDILHMGKAFHE